MDAATEQAARRMYLQKGISATLSALRECCQPPLQEALWPSDEQLRALDLAVVSLAQMGRKKQITVRTPIWKAYDRVHKQHPEVHLILRVEELVRRADKLLRT